eukprot:15265303-Alexandrium_andersonii.AAC.1
MSASLVGSEMCIRDRCNTAQIGLLGSSGRQSKGRLRGRAVQAPSACTPVSYTHLTLPTICSV